MEVSLSTPAPDTPAPGTPTYTGDDRQAARAQLLDVAEELFAEHGFVGTSTRMVARLANINLGSLHYYFNSKEALYLAVFQRRGKPFVAERMRRLGEAQARHGDKPVPVGELVRCYVQPFLMPALRKYPLAYAQLHARLASEPEELALLVRGKVYDETTRIFVQAFRKTLAHLPEEVLYWRLHFLMGAYTYSFVKSGRLEFISGGKCDSSDVDGALTQILPFLVGGLTAPVPGTCSDSNT